MKMDKEVKLTEQECRALNEFIGSHWDDFREDASRYLTDDEIDYLGEKLIPK
jgi:hypothetical protein